tara:strand:- start:90486 stop:90653 length:168 start_codon:yes stop_codon:yes gene_type:complete
MEEFFKRLEEMKPGGTRESRGKNALPRNRWAWATFNEYARFWRILRDPHVNPQAM